MSRVAILVNNPFVTDSRGWKLARSLADAGYAVTVVARPGDDLPEREEANGFEILRIPQPQPRWLPAPRLPDAGRRRGGLPGLVRETAGRVAQAARYLRLARAWAGRISRQVPTADAWLSEGLITLPVALELAARHGGRVVYDSADLHVESARFASLPGPWRRLLRDREQSWIRRCDALLTASRASADVLERTTGVAADVVLNGPLLATLPTERDRLLHAVLALPPATPLALTFGQVAPGRGVEALIDAMALIPGVHLAVVGYGSLYEAMRERAARGTAADRIHFLPAVKPEDIQAITAAADVAVMPIEPTTVNHRLTVPTKLLDAMGAGTPVVASDLPGMARIVQSSGCGVLCKPGDPRDIARAIQLVLGSSRKQREAYGAAGRRAIEETYAWEHQVVVLLDRLRQLGVAP